MNQIPLPSICNGFHSWDQVFTLLQSKGVSAALIKPLAEKQDNEKNQIYIYSGSGSVLEKIGQVLPMRISRRGASRSTSKTRSLDGSPIWEGSIDWNWLSIDGNYKIAPNTKAIFYFQFPEVRLSGFLSACPGAPDALRRIHQPRFGKRILVFGVGYENNVFALVVTEHTDPSLFPIPNFERHPTLPAFLLKTLAQNAFSELLEDLRHIRRQGWHISRILQNTVGPPKPFKGTQGGGYTLEALLGIPSNPSKVADRDGIEIKSFSSTKVSLMTPVPDGGVQAEEGLLNFLKRFGRQSRNDPELFQFNGWHKYLKRNPTTGLTLTVFGYTKERGFLSNETDVRVGLISDSNEVACSWSYIRLFESWNRKHNRAAYVSSEKRNDARSSVRQSYAFGKTVYLCERTSSRLLLDAIISGDVVYDPGDTSKSNKTQKPKPRPQWRLGNINKLTCLYESVKLFHL